MKKTLAVIAAASMLLCSTATAAKKEKAEKPAKEKAAKPAKEKAAKPAKVKKIKFDTAAYKTAIANKNYSDALAMLESVKELDIAQLLDKGMMLHLTGDFEQAAAVMEEATTKMDSLMPDPRKGAKNINATGDYTGTIYEYIVVDALNSLNYYKLAQKETNADEKDKKIGDAYSRLVRAADKQREYMNYYGQAEEADLAEEAAAKDNCDPESAKVLTNLGFAGVGDFIRDVNAVKLPKKVAKEDAKKYLYKSSALADYLQVVLGAQNGSNVDDFVVNELKTLSPGKVEVEYEGLGSKGRLEVLSLTDTIIAREAKDNYVPVDSLLMDFLKLTVGNGGTVSPDFLYQLLTNKAVVEKDEAGNESIKFYPEEPQNKMGFNFRWPVVNERAAPALAVKSVKLSNGDAKNAVLLEDFDQAVKNDVDLKARRIARRNIGIAIPSMIPLIPVQLVTFYATVTAADTLYQGLVGTPLEKKAAQTYFKSLQGAKEGLIGGINNVAPKAQDRQSIVLPSKAYATGFTVEPGVYTVTVEYSDGTTDVIEGVEVKAGRPVLVESRYSAAVDTTNAK